MDRKIIKPPGHLSALVSGDQRSASSNPRIPLSDRHFTSNWADRNKNMDGLKLDQLTFMIVDPSELMRQLLRDVLRTLGAREIREATDGSEAVRRMNPALPDILITEWEMAPMNGLDLTSYIRKSGECKTPHMPIIMTSAYSDAVRVCEARDSGITEYLIKPLSAASLYVRIRAVIEHPRAFVKADSYNGPDRRRHKKEFSSEERRGKPPAPKPAPAAAAPEPAAEAKPE